MTPSSTRILQRLPWLRRISDLSLGKKTVSVSLLVLLLAVANIVLVKSMLQDFNGIATTVNAAGKMRMLSQKIAYETLSIAAGTTDDSLRVNIGHDLDSFEAAFRALREGGTAFEFEIPRVAELHYAQMDEVWTAWKRYRERIQTALLAYEAASGPSGFMSEQMNPGSQPSAGASEFLTVSSELLEKTETFMSSLVHESQQLQHRALRVMYALFVLDILLILGTYAAIRRYVVAPLQILAMHCREIATGNYIMRTNYTPDDEIGQLSRALNDSASRIGELMAHLDHERQSLKRAEAMFRGLAENAMVGVYMVVNGKSFGFVSAKLAQMFGYDPDEMVNSVTIADIFLEEDLSRIEASIRKRLEGEEGSARYESKARRKDGSIFHVEVFGSALRFGGEPVIIGIMVDVTARKKAEVSARQAELVYQYTSEAIVITDAEGVIIDVNPAFTSITGYTREEAVGQRMSMLSSGRQDEEFYRAMWNDLLTTGKWQGDIWNRRKDGKEYAERLTINTSYVDGEVHCRIGLFSDVTQKKRSEAVIWRQAHYDHLTGLPNRQMLHERLQLAMSRSKLTGLPIALIFLDLDLFKEVNDTLGHDMGDELLKQVAERLSASVRKSDLVARLGGDEFTIIIEDMQNREKVEQICRKIISALTEPYMLGENITTISASVGVTFFPSDASDMTDLLKNADMAMYAAKERGRNQLCYFTPAMQQTATVRRQLLRDLHSALNEDQFRLLYQPIVDLASGRVCKGEALVRWMHPVQGIVAPSQFIPFAEDSGLITPIGDWVFRSAVLQLVEWRREFAPDFQLSVNTSPVQFERGGFDTAEWLAHLSEMGLPGDSIAVEITERLLFEVDNDAKNKLMMFRDAGVQIALDDFGTGYSSLSYLKSLDIDYIKIDQSFVRNLAPESDDLALCEAIIVMAHKLGLKVIAEGVSTEEQCDLLIRAGCDYAQGYLFSPPVTPEEFEDFFTSDSARSRRLSVVSRKLDQVM